MAVPHHPAVGEPADNRSIVAGGAWRRAQARLRALAAFLTLALSLALPAPALADRGPELSRFLCEGEPLTATVERGAVDAMGIPNSVGGTVPGSFVVLEWRQVRLQLPRGNDAGAPVFSDGKWLWSPQDPDHPEHPLLRLRRPGGDVQAFACEPSA